MNMYEAKCSLELSCSCSKPLRVYYYGTYHKGMCIDHKDQYHYTNLTFVCLSVMSVRAGGHGKPFDPS